MAGVGSRGRKEPQILVSLESGQEALQRNVGSRSGYFEKSGAGAA